ncbi:carbohydrate ABC transporter permease [Cohnella cholangitidis]|uniref:Sugar ABC transporter permease n=1 Tax=Cohnella cholangitidis TaxID=2598458 RepID=A0A7G5C0A0_9BACL|nr:sugar ABC transporter permease [Cohnella cholangitidis]QMV42634.1 sugar ABC transporter permease [Cohnella cholangitidis]
MMKNHSNLRYAQKLSFIAPAMLLLILLTGYPLIKVIQMSFFSYENPSAPVFAGIANYIAVLDDSMFWLALGNTLIFTFGTVLLVMVLGISVASLLNQNINTKVRGIFRSFLMFPWLFSSSVVGSIWILMLTPFGIVNWLMMKIGAIDTGIAWLSDETFAMIGLIITNAWRSFPFAMLMILAAFQTVPEDIKEAAEVDGAGMFRRFVSIVLPHIKGIMFTVMTLEIIWNFRSFDLVYLMTGGGPMHSTEVLSTFVYHKAFRSLDFGYASATAIFMLAVMILTSVFYLKSVMSKEDR